MNRHETAAEELDRHMKAIANLRLEQEADEEAQRAVIQEAARKAIKDNWPEMPEDERNRVVESVVNFEGLAYQWAIFRRGWSTGAGEERISVDPEIAGPRILVRAYATAEADALRMKSRATAQPPSAGQPSSLEDRLRRYLRPTE